ncbi:MAG: peptide deformylase [Candidatus Dormibacteria bacterium]
MIAQAPLRLVVEPAAVLHHRARPVRAFDGALRQLVEALFGRCDEWNGVGLAAPQVGINLQLAVIIYEGRRLAICNPQLLSRRGEVDAAEGCLSIPGHSGTVRRAERITVRYRNLQGKGRQRDFEGWLARIVQHESDHLQGVLCPERLAPGATFDPVEDEAAGAEEGAAAAKPRRRPRRPAGAGPSPDL